LSNGHSFGLPVLFSAQKKNLPNLPAYAKIIRAGEIPHWKINEFTKERSET
jgi:hypothetical protein